MKLSVIFFCIISVAFFSCQKHSAYQEIDNKTYKYVSKYTLVADHKVPFLLDSMTNPNINNIQLFRTDSVTYLTFLNRQFNSIYFYDFKTSKYKFRINIKTSGTDAVGPIVHSYYIKSPDSIYVMSYYTLSIIDRDAHVHYKKNLFFDHAGDFTAVPQMYCYSPLIAHGDTLLISCVPDKTANDESSFEGKSCMMALNTKTGSVEYHYEYPEKYRQGVYGANYMIFYNTYNPDTKQFIFSFPADNKIYYTHGDDMVPRYAGSHALGPILPMQNPKNDFEAYNSFFLHSPSYGPIYYDRFRKVYYRFALKPISDADYKAKRWWKKKSIIILDKDFNKVGEVDVPDEVSFFSCFVNEDGLYAGTDDGSDKIAVTLFKLKQT